jgi:hypothetical protein
MSEEKTTKKKKGNWFSNLLYESNDSVESTESSEEELGGINVSNSADFTTPVASVQNLAIPTSGDGVFDQRFNDSFQELMAENNIPGIDYFEMRQAITQMAGVAGLNEAACFQTAFTTLKVGDPTLTKEKLMTSIDHYDKVLVSEEAEFNAELANQTEAGVTLKRNQAEGLSSENNDLVQQIQNINEKIRKNQEDALQLNSEASSAEAQIGQTSKNFIKTLSHVRAKLDTDKQKITDLIKE